MSKFKFFLPAEAIQKAKDDVNNDEWVIGGIASTSDEDSDGEFLDPNGFEIEDFLELGFVNWHHQTKNSPSTVIGEPIVAEIRPEGFYVECKLYKDSAVAKEVYELGNVLKKNSKTRKLGFSIEGNVIERRSDDKTSPDYNYIKKASITGLAVTHMPKNAKSFADIIKGKIEDDDEEEIEKDLNTESGAALKKESVDPNLKVTLYKSRFTFIEQDEETMYDNIYKAFPDIEIQKAEQIFTIINKIKDIMTKGQENLDDSISKAMTTLGLNVQDNPFVIEKAKGETELTADEAADAVEKKTMGAANYDVSSKDDDPEVVPDTVEKALAVLLVKGVEKSSLENAALGTLINKQNQELAILKGKNENLETQIGTLGTQLGEAVSLIKGMSQNIGRFGEQSQGRKSVLNKAKFVEKESFQKANTGEAEGTVLSKSRDFKQVLDVVDGFCDSKGMRSDLSKAVIGFEVNKFLPDAVAAEIKKELGITIVD